MPVPSAGTALAHLGYTYLHEFPLYMFMFCYAKWSSLGIGFLLEMEYCALQFPNHPNISPFSKN